MKTRHKILTFAFLGALCAFMGGHFFKKRFSDDINHWNQRSSSEAKILSRAEIKNISKASESVMTRKLGQNTSDDHNSDGSDWSVGFAVKQLKSICGNYEASRARILAESDVIGAKSYFLDVLPPSQDEVKSVRKTIAQVLARVDDSKRDEMDRWVGWVIERYDPFGTSGRKIMGIRIPTDSGKPISGWTYPTADPENEMKMLMEGNMKAPADMQFYVSSDNETCERFEALLVVGDGGEGAHDAEPPVGPRLIAPRK